MTVPCAEAELCEAEAIAKRSLIDYLGLDASTEIATSSVDAVVWGDSALGCWIDGYLYTMAEEAGFRVVLAHSTKTYFVHISTEFNGHLIIVSENADEVMELLVEDTPAMPDTTCVDYHAGWPRSVRAVTRNRAFSVLRAPSP